MRVNFVSERFLGIFFFFLQCRRRFCLAGYLDNCLKLGESKFLLKNPINVRYVRNSYTLLDKNICNCYVMNFFSLLLKSKRPCFDNKKRLLNIS